jgi:hypothetical protein
VLRRNLGYHVCCSHVITTRSALGILVFENATHRTYDFSTLCLSSLPWLTSWVKQVMLTLHHEHHISWAYASTHFINRCISMCALHHARIMCITHYASLHKHHKFMCISIICSCASTSYYMHLIIRIIMSTIPLMHNSSIYINIASMSHWCTIYPVKSHCTTNGMKDVANTHKISDMWASLSKFLY